MAYWNVPTAGYRRSPRFPLRIGLPLLASLSVLLGMSHCAFAQAQDNGIVVGQAKLYDERSLESMLMSIQSGLAGSNYINPASVAQNEGMIQGGELTTSQLSVAETEAQPQPSESGGKSGGQGFKGGPGDSGQTGSGQAGAGQTGAGQTGAGQNFGGSSTAHFQPTASGGGASSSSPSSSGDSSGGAGASAGGGAGAGGQHAGGGSGGGGASGSSTNGSFSAASVGISAPLAISSQDMLQQQVGLSFEATNLSMLLEHALSDRLIFTSSSGTATPRALAVLGFQITVEPRMSDKFAVAEAEITVTSPTSSPGRPEVAMMLPQDKTYNIAKVTSDSRSINLGAFAQPFGATLSAGNSRNSTFVVYDVDTIALQRPFSSDPNSVTFAWQFRPVLGEKSVQPGTRQVYVLLSLPVSSEEDYTPVISVKTYWKSLDTKSRTVSDAPMAGASSYTLDPLSIHRLNDYDDGLRPTFNSVDMYDAGNGQVYVEASGANFSKNMTVVLNGASNNVYEQGGRLLSFTAPIASMSYSNPVIVGPYGLPVNLKLPVLKDASGAVISPNRPDEGIKINGVSTIPLDASTSDVKIQLVSKRQDNVAPAVPVNAQLIVTIGGSVYGLDDCPVGLGSDSNATHTTLDLHVPTAALHTAQKLTVRYLFAGDEYRDDYQLPGDEFLASSVSVISCDPDTGSSAFGSASGASVRSIGGRSGKQRRMPQPSNIKPSGGLICCSRHSG